MRIQAPGIRPRAKPDLPPAARLWLAGVRLSGQPHRRRPGNSTTRGGQELTPRQLGSLPVSSLVIVASCFQVLVSQRKTSAQRDARCCMPISCHRSCSGRGPHVSRDTLAHKGCRSLKPEPPEADRRVMVRHDSRIPPVPGSTDTSWAHSLHTLTGKATKNASIA